MVDESKIRAALEGLQNGKYKSIRSAAKSEGVLHTTLIGRLKGAQSPRKSHEHQQICTPQEEKALAELVQQWDSRGFAIRPELLRIMCNGRPMEGH